MTRFFTLALLLALGCQRPGPSLRPPQPETAASRAADGATQAETELAAPAKPTEEPTVWPVRPVVDDVGVFDELASEVETRMADWLDLADSARARLPSGETYVVVRGRAIALAPPTSADVTAKLSKSGDLDGDGIPNSYDVLLGAKKAALNNAPYGSPYREIEYPGGDVPTTEGVCTDTLVRAVRNAGLDLQKELHEDIQRSPKSFPMVKKPNPNIDHRRVKTLLPYFERQWLQLPTELDAEDPWLPGDVIFMQTMGDKRPDHVGIVSDRLGESGAPLIVNNWTDGHSTTEMDIAKFVPVTHRFRIPGGLSVQPLAELESILDDVGLSIDARHEQVLLVTVPTNGSDSGHLRRFERVGGTFRQVGAPVDITVGSKGLGNGRGIHPEDWRGVEVDKREGDQKAPAGVFTLGTAFGRASTAPYKGDWHYRAVGDSDVFVDDPGSQHYNQWRTGGDDADWDSAEQLSMYDLGLVVEHNLPTPEPGAGSAIFLHTWQGNRAATLGCTAMKRDALLELLDWLDQDAAPVLVQIVHP